MNNNLLIVDDTKNWQIFHSELIEQLYGRILKITTADSAREALKLARKAKSNPYKLIITDLCMESDFGLELAGEWLIKNIKMMKEYSNTSIVIISSMYNIESIAKKYNVECISKGRLFSNKILMKYMLEKLMPFLSNVETN